MRERQRDSQEKGGGRERCDCVGLEREGMSVCVCERERERERDDCVGLERASEQASGARVCAWGGVSESERQTDIE